MGCSHGRCKESWDGVKEGETSFISCSQSINDTVVMKCMMMNDISDECFTL